MKKLFCLVRLAAALAGNANGFLVCPADEYSVDGSDTDSAGTGCTACPTGSAITSTSAADHTGIADCVLIAGYYIAADALNTPVLCIADSYCPGGGAVGTAGGATACPNGGTLAVPAHHVVVSALV